MILFQPFFDTFGSTRITRAHHATIVHNHAFPIDDKEVGASVETISWKALPVPNSSKPWN